MKKTAGAALAVLMGVAGCAAAEPSAPMTVTAPPVTATATVTATANVTATPNAELGRDDSGSVVVAPIVDGVEDLKATLVGVGLVCNGWEAIGNVGGTCDGGTMLNAFPDGDTGREGHRAAVGLAYTAIVAQERSDVALLVGPNWFVRADVEGAYTLQGLIGGSVIGITAGS